MYNCVKNIMNDALQKYKFSEIRIKREWENYHRIRKEQIFDPINVIYDENHPSIHGKNNFHFALYYGSRIVSTAHVEFLNELEAALRSLSTDEPFKSQGHGKKMMEFLEEWLRLHSVKFVKMHARLSAENFYRKLGYEDCIFDDRSIQERYVNLGKFL